MFRAACIPDYEVVICIIDHADQGGDYKKGLELVSRDMAIIDLLRLELGTQSFIICGI